MTPLMCAAINGHMTTAQNLMERGCDPNLSDCNDKTALQLAQERGKREVIGFLDRKTSNKLSVGEKFVKFGTKHFIGKSQCKKEPGGSRCSPAQRVDICTQ